MTSGLQDCGVSLLLATEPPMMPWSTSQEHLPGARPRSISTPSSPAASKWAGAGQEDAGEALGRGAVSGTARFSRADSPSGNGPRSPDLGSLPARRTLVPGGGGWPHTSCRALSTACEFETASSHDRWEPRALRGRDSHQSQGVWEAAGQSLLFQAPCSLPHRLLRGDGQREGRFALELAGSGLSLGAPRHLGVSSTQPGPLGGWRVATEWGETGHQSPLPAWGRGCGGARRPQEGGPRGPSESPEKASGDQRGTSRAW